MAKKILEEEYRKLLEENSGPEQIVERLKAQLLPLDKEISDAERTIQEGILVPKDLDLKNTLENRKQVLLRSLEMETQKFNDLCKKHAQYEEIVFLRKQVEAKLQIKRKLDQQLATLQAEQALDASSQMRQMLKLKMRIDEEKFHFQNTKERLKVSTECAAKLQTFIGGKCRGIPHEETAKPVTEASEQQETKELSSSDQLGAIGGDPEMFVTQDTETQSSYVDVYICGLKEERRMIEESIKKTQKDIQMLKRENENVSGQPGNLEYHLEKLKMLGSSLEDHKKVVQKTLEDLAAGIRGALKDVDKPADVTSDNLLSCIDTLHERIATLQIYPKSKGTHAGVKRDRR
ncbi:M protein, serotype 2.1 [Nothobranchius furzeri]|uniref:M protein, serotype 2.1 n=1 Tax=Nothobranchius furzeri TaxID=105023 RepID=UPI00077D045A